MPILTFLGLGVAEGELGGSSMKEAEISVMCGASCCASPVTCFSPPLLTLSDYESECKTALCTSNCTAPSCRCRLPLGQAVSLPLPLATPHPQPRDKAAVNQRHTWLAAAPCHVASEIFIFGNEKPLVSWCPWHPQSQAAFLRQSQG